MKFLRRLKFYGFGFGMGLLIVYAMFGTRSCVSPNEQKMQELVYQEFRFSPLAKCKLKCIYGNAEFSQKQLSHAADSEFIKRAGLLLKIDLRHFEVNYDVSSVHKEPCGEYYLEPKKEFAAEHKFKMIINDCDTISKIDDISTAASITCSCQ